MRPDSAKQRRWRDRGGGDGGGGSVYRWRWRLSTMAVAVYRSVYHTDPDRKLDQNTSHAWPGHLPPRPHRHGRPSHPMIAKAGFFFCLEPHIARHNATQAAPRLAFAAWSRKESTATCPTQIECDIPLHCCTNDCKAPPASLPLPWQARSHRLLVPPFPTLDGNHA